MNVVILTDESGQVVDRLQVGSLKAVPIELQFRLNRKRSYLRPGYRVEVDGQLQTVLSTDPLVLSESASPSAPGAPADSALPPIRTDVSPQPIPTEPSLEDAELAAMKQRSKWFIALRPRGRRATFLSMDQYLADLSAGISDGTYPLATPVEVFQQDQKGSWQSSTTTLREFASQVSKLRAIFQPTWARALTGLWVGAIVGAGIKLLDTALALYAVDTRLAWGLLVAVIALAVLPRMPIVSAVAFITLAGASARLGMPNFFAIATGAVLAGALLGALPGMAAGGIYGAFGVSPRDPTVDVPREPRTVLITAIVLPTVGAITLWVAYFYYIQNWLFQFLN